jgi:hypothetical protein
LKHNTRKVVKIIDGMTLGGGKEATMLSKGPWVLDKVVESIINNEKGVKITNGMTIGGGEKTTMLIKGPWVLALL